MDRSNFLLVVILSFCSKMKIRKSGLALRVKVCNHCVYKNFKSTTLPVKLKGLVKF